MIISEVEKIITILFQESKNLRPFDLKTCTFTTRDLSESILWTNPQKSSGLIWDAGHHICILPCALDSIIESFMSEKPFKIIKSNH